MTTFAQIEIDQATPIDKPAGLAAFQQAKKTALAEHLLPTRKTESWKYSSKYLGDLDRFSLSSGSDASSIQENYQIDCYTITLIDGVPQLSDAQVGDSISLVRFQDLNDEQISHVKQGVTAKAEHLPFADLNAATSTNGLFIGIADKAEIDKPLKIVTVHTGNGFSVPRIFVHVGKHAKVTLIQEFHMDTDGGFLNGSEDITLEAGANCTYIRMSNGSQKARFYGATGVAMGRDSRFQSHSLALGCVMGRHDLQVELQEPGAECDLNAVTVTLNKEHFDHHTSIDHIAPHCTSNENYRCIAGDQSHIVFNGRIHIHRDAQKTLGAMSNKNLILSNGAEIDSKPELEIYADDVKCAHGTTIGQLNEKEVYYLKTRGMSDEQARQMLTLGFVLEIVHANPIEEIAEYWETELSKLLSFGAQTDSGSSI